MADTCSPFENLDPAILICILSACHSANDLWACIRASPVLYQCFSRYRKQMLLRFNFNLLGSASAVRDLVFITCGRVRGDYSQERVESAVDSYRHLELKEDTDGVPVDGDLDWATITFITKQTRAVRYLADLYTHNRLRYFKTIRKRHLSTLPTTEEERFFGTTQEDDTMDWETPSMSEMERITSALICLQLVRKLGETSMSHDIESLIAMVFPVFNAWEWEQVNEVESFLICLISGMLPVEMLDWNGYDRRCVESHRRSDYFLACLRNPEVLHQRLTGLLGKYPKMRKRILWGEYVCGLKMATCGVHWIAGSDSWRRRIARKYLPIRGLVDEAMRLWGKADEDHLRLSATGPDSPPWAWYVATGGRNYQRWGLSLKPPNFSDEHNKKLIELWRWTGMVFWDKDRAELILETLQLKECNGFGWLYARVEGMPPN